MSADVLVLNKQFLPIQIADWQQVMSLLFQGHAEAVDQNYVTYGFEDWCELSKAMTENPSGFKHTATLRIAVPDVIRLTRYERMPSSEVKYTRSNVYDHFKNMCSYCGKKFTTAELNIDHVMPSSRGGKTNWENTVLSCIPCNSKKANRTPEEAGMRLLVKPVRPKYKGPAQLLMKMPFQTRQSWSNFIDMTYWESELEE